MKVIKASYVILSEISEGGLKELQHIEKIGRVCYKSEDKISPDGSSAKEFVKMLIGRGHEAMIEHSSLSVKFIVDRGVSHELVRHRIASFAQESTRYCNYSKDKFEKEITFISPLFFDRDTVPYLLWEKAMKSAEELYFSLLDFGVSPQEARSVLPNSTKTEIIITANYREWRNFFKLRTAAAAHPQMREVTRPLLEELKSKIPVIFDDINAGDNMIFYLCDGNVKKCCNSEGCYKNGGECVHTTDVFHAVNFLTKNSLRSDNIEMDHWEMKSEAKEMLKTAINSVYGLTSGGKEYTENINGR